MMLFASSEFSSPLTSLLCLHIALRLLPWAHDSRWFAVLECSSPHPYPDMARPCLSFKSEMAQLQGDLPSTPVSSNSSLTHSSHPILFSQHLSPSNFLLGSFGHWLVILSHHWKVSFGRSRILSNFFTIVSSAHKRDSINIYWMNGSVPWLCSKTVPNHV